MKPRRKGFSLALLSLAAYCALAAAGASASDELATVRQAIQSKGAQWIASDTSLFRLPPEERRLRLGVTEPQAIAHTRLLAASPHTPSVQAPPPSTLDWRSNGGNWVTSVKDQVDCKASWAFATAAALESSALIARNLPNTVPDRLDQAEQILISCSGAGDCTGGGIEPASDFLRDTGIPPESYYPYTHSNGNCANASPGWQAATDRIQRWEYATNGSATVLAIKSALYLYGPLVAIMEVYSDFYSYSGGIYSFVTGTDDGLHAVLLVGYDDNNGYFIAKNSWGTGWGESGYFRIAYTEIDSVIQFGKWTILYTGGTCAYSLTPTSGAVDAAGGAGTVAVTTSNGTCTWGAFAWDPWITLTSAWNRTGNGSVGYSVPANPHIFSRTGTIAISGQLFTLTQAAQTCTQTISPTTSTLSASGGTGSIAITTYSECPWSAMSNAPDWLIITSSNSGTGNYTLTYVVTQNNSVNGRTGTISVAGQTFTLTQNGQLSCTYSLSPTSERPSSAANNNLNIGVTAWNGCTWTATSNASWITIRAGATGNGNGAVTYAVSANTGLAFRTGTITFAPAGLTFIVTQASNGKMSVSPLYPRFGTIKKGAASTETVKVSNLGSGAIRVGPITMAGNNDFHVKSSDCGLVLPGKYCTITVKFSPTSIGALSATMTVNCDVSSPAAVSLTGSGY